MKPIKILFFMILPFLSSCQIVKTGVETGLNTINKKGISIQDQVPSLLTKDIVKRLAARAEQRIADGDTTFYTYYWETNTLEIVKHGRELRQPPLPFIHIYYPFLGYYEIYKNGYPVDQVPLPIDHTHMHFVECYPLHKWYVRRFNDQGEIVEEYRKLAQYVATDTRTGEEHDVFCFTNFEKSVNGCGFLKRNGAFNYAWDEADNVTPCCVELKQ